MNHNRLTGAFNSLRTQNEAKKESESLRGFTVNPLGESVTPAQAQLYQAAFQKAQKEMEEPDWPMAEWWN